MDDPGAATLFDAADNPIDFITFNGDTTPVPDGLSWSGTLTSSTDGTLGLSRVPEDQDNDLAADFCIAPITRGTANAPCSP